MLVQVIIVPFMKTQYTMDSLVRLDMAFGEQIQIVLFSVAGFISVFAFASAQDKGYSKNRVLTSAAGRGTLTWSAVMANYMFLLASVLSEVGFK
jgi:hypothetical protein